MKKILLILWAAVIAMPMFSQDLISKYKKGSVKLVPDGTYANGNNWAETLGDDEVKSLVLNTDGSILINFKHRRFIARFSPEGMSQKFTLSNSTGGGLKKTKTIKGVINNTYYSEVDYLGNMYCYSVEGRYKKKLKLNYLVRDIITLSNNKLALVGWSGGNVYNKDFVAIVDYNTNKQKIIWEHKTEVSSFMKSSLYHYVYKFKKGGVVSFPTIPFTNRAGLALKPQIAFVDNELVVVLPVTGEIVVYDVNGNKKSTTKVNWENQFLSVDELKNIQKKAISKFEKSNPMYANWVSKEENNEAQMQMLKEMKADLDKISEPLPKPYFSMIIKDSDDNLLFFEIPKEDKKNKFNVWVYNNGGEFVCQSSFICDEYELEINPSKLLFYKGYIYSVQKLKSNNSQRLVRFKLE